MCFKKSISILTLGIVLISFFGCKKDDQTRLQAGWTSKDPIAIPFNARNNEKELGNLVNNPSFETGKVYYAESTVKSYDIAGWKKIGQNITWINNSVEKENDEVYDGLHSIKIERSNADETEKTGEGIISDYIKVIPGNYSLKLFLKLKDVYPNQSRLGTKMYDAINIELKYFDKNKIEISGEDLNAFTRSKIDNSFKAFSLANYSHIKEFGWGEIYGKTANFPYFDGDIPDDARYVKLFIGLKGTGTMWIDQIDFRYTDQNFTMLERLQPYFDSSYLPNEMVFPQPQKLHKNSKFLFYHVDASVYPIIVIPQNAKQSIKEFANGLKSFLEESIASADKSVNPKIKIVNQFNLPDSLQQMVISVGSTTIYNQYKDLIKDTLLYQKEQSYLIYQLKNKEKLVFVNSRSDEGYLNALRTLKQLFVSKNATFYGANIIDYPDFKKRNLFIDSFKDDLASFNRNLQLLSEYKLNGLFLNWNEEGSNYPFRSIQQIATQNIHFGAMVDLMDYSDKKSFSSLIKENFHSIILDSGDSSDCDEMDLKKRCSSDFEFVNQLYNELKNKNYRTQLGFIPRWSNLSSIDQGYEDVYFYLYHMNQSLPRSIDLYWSGPTDHSSSIDCAEFNRIKLLYNSTPSLLGYSLMGMEHRFDFEYTRQYYAGKIRTQSIFKPHNLRVCSNLYHQNTNSDIIIGSTSCTEMETISILTALDFAWNEQSYNPNKSAWIALNKLYGKQLAIKIIRFNDAYFGLKEICQKIENNGLLHKNSRVANKFEIALEKAFSEIRNNCSNTDLITELELLKKEQVQRYKNIMASYE